MSISGPTYIYSGDGAWNVSVDQTQQMLEQVLDSRSIKQVKSLYDVDKYTRLVVVPGGNLVNMMSLENANKKIREYINDGGRFLGICAGGIYASEGMLVKPPVRDIPENLSITVLQKSGKVYRDNGKPSSIFLSLNPHKCVAPHIVKEVNASDPGNLCAVDVFTPDADTVEIFKACHYSGPAFLEASSKAKVLLRYKDAIELNEVSGRIDRAINDYKYQLTGKKLSIENPIAAMSFPYGSGQVVLTGIHPEINPETFPQKAKEHQFKKNLPKELTENDSGRKIFVNKIFTELKLSSNL